MDDDHRTMGFDAIVGEMQLSLAAAHPLRPSPFLGQAFQKEFHGEVLGSVRDA